MDSRALGRSGEDAAAKALVKEGWTLLERNARVRAGEIDIVAERRGVMGFVEVKARRSLRSGSPEEAVDERKSDRVARAAAEYLAARGLAAAKRAFLVAAVELDPGGNPLGVRLLPMQDGPSSP